MNWRVTKVYLYGNNNSRFSRGHVDCRGHVYSRGKAYSIGLIEHVKLLSVKIVMLLFWPARTVNL